MQSAHFKVQSTQQKGQRFNGGIKKSLPTTSGKNQRTFQYQLPRYPQVFYRRKSSTKNSRTSLPELLDPSHLYTYGTES